jgi:hypothetical protein
MNVKTFQSGVPFPSEIREIISEAINSEAFVQFPCDFGHTPLNTIMFAFEDPETNVQPVLKMLRKNGISILSIQETPLKRFPLFPYTKWYDITFMAYSSEN